MDSQQTLLDFSKPLEPDLTSERNVESPLVQGAKKSELIKCACGCESNLNKYDSRGRIRFYIHGHSRVGKYNPNSRNNLFKKGHIPTQEIRNKISCSNKGRIATLATRKKLSNSLRGKNKNKEYIEKYLIGKNNPSWKGGVTPLQKIIRTSEKYLKWRMTISNKDNFTCQYCRNIGNRLHAHHIKPYSNIIIENNIKTLQDAYNCNELWLINNGITLCKICHKCEHKLNGTGNKRSY